MPRDKQYLKNLLGPASDDGNTTQAATGRVELSNTIAWRLKTASAVILRCV